MRRHIWFLHLAFLETAPAEQYLGPSCGRRRICG